MRIGTGAVTPTADTLVALLRRQAERYGEKVVFGYSDDGGESGRIQFSYGELDRKARAIAATLQASGAAGERVLVFCRNGLEHIAGVFGCWYAGAIAVPVHESFPPRLSWVVPDVEPAFALTSAQMTMVTKTSVDTLVQMLGREPLRWALTEYGDAEAWVPPDVTPDDTALLLYTSGTTSSPKAVVLTHRNIMCNVKAMRIASGDNDTTIGVSWMPHQHSMSLIAQIVVVVDAGATGYGMSPDVFTARPIRWLEMISELGATSTSAPHWAYPTCVEHSRPAQRTALDLSGLVSVGGGIQAAGPADIAAFADAFAAAGFRPEAFHTGYGLTEATSGVSSGDAATVPVLGRLDQAALAEGRVVDAAGDDGAAIELLGSGPPIAGQLVVIVDPETWTECAADEIGEIWIAGSNVAQGYWRRPEETRETFGGMLADTGEGPFLRTGDLGFLRRGELFVTGRCKDLITIGGSKYYPDAIEATVSAAHPALLATRCAAFTVERERAEKLQPVELIVAQEVNLPRVGPNELDEIAAAITAAVGARYGIDVTSVLLVAGGGLPVTGTGKIQRERCRRLFAERGLQTLAEWHAPQRPYRNARTPNEELFLNDLAAAQTRQEREDR